MVNFYIAYDNQDVHLGDYFEKSKDDLVNFIKNNCKEHSIREIPTRICNQAYIDFNVKAINENNFLFIVYSHGNHDSLIAGGSTFVKKDINTSIFINSVFYAMSCLTANELGRNLIQHGTHAFIGFLSDAEALIGEHQSVSIECDNSGIKKFIEGFSIKDAIDHMKNVYTQKSDWLIENGEAFSAAYLTSNRDSLLLKGNSDLKFSEFILND